MKSPKSRRRSQWLRLVAQVCVPLTLAHASVRVQAQEGNSGPGTAPSGDAAEALTPPPRAALQHYEKGRALYLAGKYREAAVELEAARELDPDSPNLVYNLAHVYELLGEIDLAIRYYRHYRELVNDPADIARIDSTLQRLQGARHQVVDPPPPPPAAPAPERPQRGVADAAFWTVTTFALGGLVTGGVLGGMALHAEGKAQDFVIQQPEDIEKREKLIDRADRLALGSDISLLAGAVLGTTAILLFALRTKPAKSVAAPQARWNVDLGPTGAFLSYRRQL
ncbi:MAG TPA: tetratricopeptide repeat protein [Polyangiales bacterium]